MSPRPKDCSVKDQRLARKAHSQDKWRHVGSRQDEMTLTQKLMLSASLWGIEASINFEQLYSVPILQTLGLPLSLVSIKGLVSGAISALLLSPILQTLGLPLSLVSMPGLVSGAISALLLPPVGWLTDHGANPHRRKTLATVLVSCVLVAGMLCLLAANTLHLRVLLDHDSLRDIGTNLSSHLPERGSSLVCLLVAGMLCLLAANALHLRVLLDHDSLQDIATNLSSHLPERGSSLVDDSPVNEYTKAKSLYGGGVIPGPETNCTIASRPDPATTVSQEEDDSGVPFKAGLGMLGIILLDIGYDGGNAFSKSYVVASSPRCQHTSLFATGIIVASAGGVSTAALGVVDFASLLCLSYVEGGSLSIQTSVQAVVTVIVTVMGVALTITTGGRLASQKLSSPQTMSVVQPVADITHGTGLTREDLPTRINPTDALNNPTLSADIGRTLVELEENENETMISEQTPLLAVCNVRERSDGEDRTDQAFHCPEQGVNSTTAHPEEVEKEDEDDDSGLRVGYCEWGYKVKIGLVTASLFFAFGLVAMFSMTSSDILGKAIYGGDPKAPPGSDSLTKYQDGTRMASWGFLVYYVSYLLISFVHPRLLAFLGYRVEFVTVQLLMSVAVMVLALTERLEVFFLVTVVAGLHRACNFVVPYAVVSDIINSLPCPEEDKGRKTGLAMAVVTASLPLALCLLFTWVGPLEQATGLATAPLWMGTGFGCLSVLAFLALGPV